MNEKKKFVCIGSSNPVKINCTKKAFETVFPGSVFEFSGVKVESGVSHQPFGEEETLLGAINRIDLLSSKFPLADFRVGIEGGLEQFGELLYAFAWIVIKDATRTGKARTATFEIPSGLRELIEKGYELGEADDIYFKRSHSKYQDGTVGKLTGGVIDRVEYYTHAMILALIPFKNKDLYNS